MSGVERTFEGLRILVSGASSGIGKAIAVALARRGAAPILLGRDEDRLRAAAAECGPEATVLPLDLSQLDGIVPAVRALAKEGGRLYGFCHSAGTVDTLALSASKPEKFEGMLSVNYLSGMELSRAICRRDVMDPEGGSIVFLGSIYASVGVPGQIAYSGSKGAVLAAARAMAIELARRAIRVNVLSPGMVRTEMTEKAFSSLSEEQLQKLEAAHPLGFGNPEDVAQAAAFLLSPASRWITGTNLVVDGGRSAQ